MTYKTTFAGDLSAEDKNRFTEMFNSICEASLSFDMNKIEGEFSWGHPWDFQTDIYLIGESVEEMAENFFEEFKGEIERNDC